MDRTHFEVNVIMQDKVIDRKQQILVSAMKLFATQGYTQTTMQEIAQYCKMSKGSVYLHFSSKEELLLDIYKYFHQLFDDRMQWIQQDTELSPRQRLLKKIEVHLNMWLEYPEFVTIQIRENPGFSNAEIKQFLRGIHIKALQALTESLIEVYGDSFQPYTLDASIILGGLTATFMGINLVDEVELNIEQISGYVMTTLDYVARGLQEEQPAPLISENNWPAMFQAIHMKSAGNPPPLLLAQQMRTNLSSLSIGEEERQDALESLHILEQELMELNPRRAILRGMLANLNRLEILHEQSRQLAHAISHLHGI